MIGGQALHTSASTTDAFFERLQEPLTDVTGAVILLLGVVLACVGRAFKKTQVVVSGLLTGALISFIIVTKVDNADPLGDSFVAVLFLGCLSSGA